MELQGKIGKRHSYHEQLGVAPMLDKLKETCVR